MNRIIVAIGYNAELWLPAGQKGSFLILFSQMLLEVPPEVNKGDPYSTQLPSKTGIQVYSVSEHGSSVWET